MAWLVMLWRCTNAFASCWLQYAQQPVVQLTLRHMMELGQSAWLDQGRLIYSAEFVREEVCPCSRITAWDLQGCKVCLLYF